MDLERIKDRIKDLEGEKQRNPKESFLIDPQLKGLYDILRKEEKKSDGMTRGKLERKKKELVEEKQKAKIKGDLEEYLSIEKEIKRVNTKLREVRGVINYLTLQEFARLKNKVQESKQGLKYLMIIQLAYECGLRVSEATGLKMDDINILEGSILCRRVKGSETNTILLTKKTRELLKSYLKQYNPREHLFLNRKGGKFTAISINDMFKRYCEKARIPKEKARFHSIKHSRAVHLADSGLMVQEIKHLLGHKSISSTMIYYSFTKSQEDVIYSKLKGY